MLVTILQVIQINIILFPQGLLPKFIDLIKPYMVNSMLYKLGLPS
jgi:hypothetical protein